MFKPQMLSVDQVMESGSISQLEPTLYSTSSKFKGGKVIIFLIFYHNFSYIIYDLGLIYLDK